MSTHIECPLSSFSLIFSTADYSFGILVISPPFLKPLTATCFLKVLSETSFLNALNRNLFSQFP